MATSNREPRHAIGLVSQATNVPEQTIRVWMRKITLDANRDRDDQSWRQFSDDDVAILSMMFALTRNGFSIVEAFEHARRIIPDIDVTEAPSGYAASDVPDRAYFTRDENGAWLRCETFDEAREAGIGTVLFIDVAEIIRDNFAFIEHVDKFRRSRRKRRGASEQDDD